MTFMRKVKPERTCNDFRRSLWMWSGCKFTNICVDRKNYLSWYGLCTGVEYFPRIRIVYERRMNERRMSPTPEATCSSCGKKWYGRVLKYKRSKCSCGKELDVVLVNGIRIVRDLEKEVKETRSGYGTKPKTERPKPKQRP